MGDNILRAEIVVNGLVQGVGFRFYVYSRARALGLKGMTKNLYSGEVFTIAEGEKALVEEFCEKIKVGPMHSQVRGFSVKWLPPTNEFSTFEIEY